MTKEILILRNVHRENPGLLEKVLIENKLNYNIIDIDELSDNQSIDSIGAFIVLGGPASANDLSEKMVSELTLIKKIVDAGIPYLGICLGLQTLVKAMGGKVIKCEYEETGFRDKEGEFFKIKLTPEGRKDNFFYTLPDTFNVFQLHGEMVQITSEMKLLATGEYCRNQIVKIGNNAYGIQSHFELTEELLNDWIIEDSDLCKLDRGLLMSDFHSLKETYDLTGRQLFNNFLEIAGFRTNPDIPKRF